MLTSFHPGPVICQIQVFFVHSQIVNTNQHDRARYRVIFAKDAQELEGKLNDPSFVPSQYSITHLTFNSGRAEYLVIVEREQ
jgi:hypothetical protein